MGRNNSTVKNSNMITNKKYILPFALISCLFFLWAFLHNINPILIPHLKKACRLSDTQSAFIDTAVYLAYFLVALPAGGFIYRYGYKRGIQLGLLLFAAGFLLFLPAASGRAYPLFLLALFIGAAGATFLETAANPYVTRLGDENSAPLRINLAQSFNGIGAFIAPIIGGRFILSGVEHSPAALERMEASGSLQPYLEQEAGMVKGPYLILGIIVLVLLVVLSCTRLPEIREAATTRQRPFSATIFRHRHLVWAVTAQLFYVGAQAGIGSFFIRYAARVGAYPEKQAAYLWGSVAMTGFMAGRFFGTFLLRYICATRLLLAWSLLNVLILLLAVYCKGTAAVYILMAAPFFMSVMYPTIFAMGISGLGNDTKMGSALLVMAIAGGALFPVIMGRISDAAGGNIQLAYWVPALCFAVIAFFAYRFRNILTPAPLSENVQEHAQLTE